MFQVYFTDKVNPSMCVYECNTLKEAKKWISEQLKGYTMVDEDHPCSEEEFYSSATAYYVVYDGNPVVLESDFKIPAYSSNLFYTRQTLFDLKPFKSKSKPFNIICG